MAKLLSFPFRVAPSGFGVTVEQGSDAYYRESLATLLLTEQGERPMRPTMGIPDVAYKGFLYSTFQAQVEDEMPEIESLDVSVERDGETTETVQVTFSVTREATR